MWYVIFLFFVILLVVVVVFGCIVMIILKEVDESIDVIWVNIIMDGIKLVVVILVFVFL